MPKAPSDGLCGCDFSSHLAGPYMRHSVHEGFVPSRWKKANVVVPPALKVQPPRLVESVLRPISLTATLVKVLESFAGSWIVERVGDRLHGRPAVRRPYTAVNRQRRTRWPTCCTTIMYTPPSTTTSLYVYTHGLRRLRQSVWSRRP